MGQHGALDGGLRGVRRRDDVRAGAEAVWGVRGRRRGVARCYFEEGVEWGARRHVVLRRRRVVFGGSTAGSGLGLEGSLHAGAGGGVARAAGMDSGGAAAGDASGGTRGSPLPRRRFRRQLHLLGELARGGRGRVGSPGLRGAGGGDAAATDDPTLFFGETAPDA